jgi:flavodoxin
MVESTKIYYFSGTGNSLSIAKDLQSTLKNVELLSIAELMRRPGEIVIKGDVIGFVFPVYFGRAIFQKGEGSIKGKNIYHEPTFKPLKIQAQKA